MASLWKFIATVITSLGLATGALAADRWLVIPDPPPMLAAADSGYAPVNGIQMYYAIYGRGQPVLLVHGGLALADISANQVIDLAEDHKVIAADSRGHGRSSRPAAPSGYDLMASDCLALLDHLKLDKVALVGWSDGGIIGLDIAMKHPERLTKLFAHAANATVDGVILTAGDHPVLRAYIKRIGGAYKRLTSTTPLSSRSGTCVPASRLGRGNRWQPFDRRPNDLPC